MEAFGTKLRRTREQLKVSMADVADALGITVVQYSDIERNRCDELPTDDQIRKISDYLGLDFSYVKSWAY